MHVASATPYGTVSCPATAAPFLNDCGTDPQGAFLRKLLGTVQAPNTGPLGGTLVRFSQNSFAVNGWANGLSMDSNGWRVREVAAHLTLAQADVLTALRAMVQARGSFNRMIRDTAVRQAELPVEQYAELLRGLVGSRRKAPGVTHLEPLIDTLVHGQDIALPLGRTRPVPARAAGVAATRAWTMGWPFHARRRLTGFELRAVDHPWSVGHGPRVEGPMAAVLLLVTGRRAALSQLSGPGLAELEARLSPGPN